MASVSHPGPLQPAHEKGDHRGFSPSCWTTCRAAICLTTRFGAGGIRFCWMFGLHVPALFILHYCLHADRWSPSMEIPLAACMVIGAFRHHRVHRAVPRLGSMRLATQLPDAELSARAHCHRRHPRTCRADRERGAVLLAGGSCHHPNPVFPSGPGATVLSVEDWGVGMGRPGLITTGRGGARSRGHGSHLSGIALGPCRAVWARDDQHGRSMQKREDRPGRSRVSDRAGSCELTQLTPSFSAAILVPSTRFLIFWNAISRA